MRLHGALRAAPGAASLPALPPGPGTPGDAVGRGKRGDRSPGEDGPGGVRSKTRLMATIVTCKGGGSQGLLFGGTHRPCFAVKFAADGQFVKASLQQSLTRSRQRWLGSHDLCWIISRALIFRVTLVSVLLSFTKCHAGTFV